ncbi:hypothetical protein IPZ58_25255 [Streptomyces roseoverticillatus]|uniref:hypothetical protein n=1 Tax=Streptomyces roseoverticillatus TaxID=66429 RepID=UPI001F15CF8E|nr:hypothetical protein [Streptomyces roseoverticillatus]MCF3104874.1 hypothetical protein [Streptomyces roseoverticillatus]
MPALARLIRIGLAAGTAATLITGLATSAQAATGTIRYFDVNQQGFRIDNPPDNVCFNLQARADEIDNETNKTVRIYLNADCVTRVTDVPPGGGRSHIGGPRSVRVLP